MSSEQSNHENLNPDEPLDDFEAALAALRPHVDRSQSKTEFIPFDVPGHTATLRCANPIGHEFVCLHCGADAPRIGRARRRAWPAALAATSSVAAALFVMLVVDRSARVADRRGVTVAPKTTAPAAARPGESPARVEIGGDLVNARRRLAPHRENGQRILSTADIELRDDLLASRDGFNGRGSDSFIDLDNAGARLSNRAEMRRLLREYGIASPAE